MHLNDEQRAAVHYRQGPLLVLAGAGSGKTRVITQKIVHLVQGCGLAAKRIIAVTFTNKAAREMKQRISQNLSRQDMRGLTVSTFHNLGLTIIKREARALGFKPGVSIFDAADSLSLLKELSEQELTLSKEALERVQTRISNWKNDLILADQALHHAVDEFEQKAALLYQEYQRCLKAYNAVDFDDLILSPVQLLKNQPDILEKWQHKVGYMLVDEYQDTNMSQYLLIKLLVGQSGQLTVVGDDDQSIYTWRGARPENLAELQQDFPHLRVIKLEQNYRSFGRILKCANTLIANNSHLFDKKLWSALGFGDPLKVIYASDEENEAERVVAEILSHKFKQGARYADYAILYRGNHQSRMFEQILRKQRVPYRLTGGTSFFSRTEIKDIMAYLRLLVNPDDDNAFLRVINVPRREIGPTTVRSLGEYAAKREVSLMDACYEMGVIDVLPVAALEKLTVFTRFISEIAERAKNRPIETIREMLHAIDYDLWLMDTASSPKSGEKRVENARELVAWLERMVASNETEEVSLQELVSKMMLIDMLDRQQEEGSEDEVQLMTLHAAKGLEFPYVFLVGMEEELLPHRTSIDEDNIEEERRLAYVGITRAQRALYFTVVMERRRQGEKVATTPSRFLAELPADDLEHEGRPCDSTPEQRRQKGSEKLAMLKEMLAAS
ncbi:ATP-dependent DNA helicase rep [Piscirickettsia salmonis]|uniref:ATP-dependent DNA helicase Rep n=1 Tax=Piscirickettsia salmonis TaxID=1238 RepID=A0A1L6TFZ5_PISSA|nr:DNA helicase Rep [Piscirickettsia salmonis]AKP74743.1 ATP-dependent DNA helicase Rep [Piscirickettsia salmonis LF-89 = ATCC VR-1361]ALB21328.1 DNA helicase UvrD [Piscirickettsia salmonis]ALY01568.1 ATP-dependent DNA helicase Rep [Piscirickettsia salmonis]AMA41081.1 ATP-dependent DNA helicase Rep [Piscirickettsia salmonis]AOS36270.1 ATP-dependent DNA helicase Rep [Piscirickettsia salmonis]